MFTSSAPLWEEMLTDDRIAAVVDTRIGGLMCAEMSFSAGGDKAKARKLADAMGGDDRTRDDGLWRRIVSHETAKEILKWKVGLGVAFGPVEWTATKDSFTPRLKCWHPKHLRWDHGKRRFYVVTMEGNNIELPDTEEEPRSNGEWFVWGGYRSWMNGLIRSLGMKFIDRAWNERDWSRRNEKFGMAIIEGKHPSAASNEDKENWQNQLANLGNESTIMTPQPNEKTGTAGYGIDIHELSGEGWQCFGDRKNSLDIDIAVRVLGQELTTTTGPNGNRALGEVHEKIRTDIKKDDASFFSQAREQVLCWYAYHNLGDPTLAPYPQPMIGSPDNPLDDAQELLTLVSAIEKAPPELDVMTILEAHGQPVLEGDALAEAVERKKSLQPPPPMFPGQGPGQAPPKGQPTDQQGEQEQAAPPVDLRAVAQLSEAISLRATGTGKARKNAKYQTVQAQRAARVASKAMRPFVEKVLAAIDGAQSFEDLRKVIVAEARKGGADMDQLSKLVANVNMLARLHGREAALVNVLHNHKGR